MNEAYLEHQHNHMEENNEKEEFSYLEKHNKQLDKKIQSIKSQVNIKRTLRGYADTDKYFHQTIVDKIYNIIKEKYDIQKDDIDATFIDRKDFGADLCIKIQKIITTYGVKEYVAMVVPDIKNMILNATINDNNIESIDTKGIYLNIKFKDTYLFNSLQAPLISGEKYGENAEHKGENIVIDYSSPNTAKHLHAGHIRSTILGHVLGNIYEANGYTVHRINHVNDRGGFGFLMAGYQQRGPKLQHSENKNDMLFAIYTLYRNFEKITGSESEFLDLSTEDKAELQNFVGPFSTYQELGEKFIVFKKLADQKFTNLEIGKKEEVALWENIVNRSMQDFQKFYDTLNIHQDYVIGESFYADKGKESILNSEKEGKVCLFTIEIAQQQINLLQEKLENKIISEKEYETTKREIENDIGCYVVILDNFERFVVLKGNQSSIYATRDIGAIKYRIEGFNPSKIVYVVGQEQKDHFEKLFEFTKSKEKNKNIDLKHIYFGFYIDEDSKKKLSSREGASNVNKILSESIRYFKEKYANNNDFSEEEKETIAKCLGVGSIVYNDIKKDKKGPVLINKDLSKTIQKFEEAGGAYIIYASCRAKSIIKRYGMELPKLDEIVPETLEDIEISLINKINQFPLIVEQACENHDPAVLAEFLYNISREYNAYYANHQVLKGDNRHRLLITKCVAQVIDNGLKICHIQPLEKI